MAQPVLVKNLAIGEGQPKIAVPLTAPTLSGLEEAIHKQMDQDSIKVVVHPQEK